MTSPVLTVFLHPTATRHKPTITLLLVHNTNHFHHLDHTARRVCHARWVCHPQHCKGDDIRQIPGQLFRGLVTWLKMPVGQGWGWGREGEGEEGMSIGRFRQNVLLGLVDMVY